MLRAVTGAVIFAGWVVPPVISRTTMQGFTKVDFSGDKKATAWVAAGNTHFADGHTAESMRDAKPPVAPGVAFGKTSENRSYL